MRITQTVFSPKPENRKSGYTYIYIYIYIHHRASSTCWCVWALSNNLNHPCSILILIWMVLGVLDCPLRGPAPHFSYSLQRLTPPDLATFFRCSFLGTNFSQMVPQSEYSSDLGAQKAPFWLPFWSPFWARLQSEN